MRTVSPLRFARLKMVFEGRKKQFTTAREPGAHPHAYGTAVVKYVRARTAWRAARGWGP